MRRHLYIFSLFVILNTYFYAAVVLIFIFQAFFIRRLRNMQDIRYFSFISNLKRIFCIYNNIVLFFWQMLDETVARLPFASEFSSYPHDARPSLAPREKIKCMCSHSGRHTHKVSFSIACISFASAQEQTLWALAVCEAQTARVRPYQSSFHVDISSFVSVEGTVWRGLCVMWDKTAFRSARHTAPATISSWIRQTVTLYSVF